MTFVKIHRDAPGKGGPGNAQILKTRLDEIVDHFVLSGNGLDEFLMGIVVFHKPVGILGKTEEVGFLFGFDNLPVTVGTFAVFQLAFCPEGFTGGAV